MSQNKDTSNTATISSQPQDNQVYLASAANKIVVYEAVSKQQLCTVADSAITTDGKKGGDTNVVNFSWSDDNKIVAFCQSGSNKLFFSKSGIEEGNGEFIKSYTICEVSAVVTDVQFSHDSTSVAYGCSNGTVGILNLKTKKKDLMMTTHKQGMPIVAVHFNMNDTLVASASNEGSIYVQGTSESNKTAASFTEPYHVTCMKFSAVKSSILAAGFENGKIIIWDVQSVTKKTEMQAHSSQCSQLAFSPVNNLLLTSCGHDGKIQFFDIATSKNVKTIYTKNDNVNVALTSIAFCHDGHTIAVGAINGKIFINNLKDKNKGQIEMCLQEGKKINCLHFSRPFKQGSGNASALILPSPSLAVNPSEVAPRPSSGLSQSSKPLLIAPAKITLGEVQNTALPSRLPPSLPIKPQKPPQQQSTSSLSTHSQANPIQTSVVNLSQRILSQSKIKGGEPDQVKQAAEEKERAIKFIEEQKIDNTKKRLEKQIQQMHDEISQMAGMNARKSIEKEDKREEKVLTRGASAGRQSFLVEERSQIIRESVRENEESIKVKEEQKQNQQKSMLTQELVDYLGQEIESRSEMLTHQLSQAMNNLHLELIRNFTIQENELRDSLEKIVGQNKQRRQELKYLREENLKLRNISY